MSRAKNQQPEIRILSLLADNKEFELFKMQKSTNLSYPTILKHLKRFENKKLVDVIRTEPSEKGGKEKKVYAITLKGLWMYLSELDLTTSETKERLITIMHRFPDMLLIFKKWPLFKKASVDQIMLKSFVYALATSWRSYEDIYPFGSHLRTLFESNLSSTLDTMIIVNPLLNPVNREKLRDVYLNDPEIIAVVEAFLLSYKEQHKQIEAIRVWLKAA